jgi:hypothetical protein
MNPVQLVFLVFILWMVFLCIRYFFTDVHTLQNLHNAKEMVQFSPDTLATNGTNAMAANFAYSIWLYVDNWNYRYGDPKVVFGRMSPPSPNSTTPNLSNASPDSGVGSGTQPCPVVTLGAAENTLNVSVACYPGADTTPSSPPASPKSSSNPRGWGGGSGSSSSTIVHTCTMPNIPLQRWVHIVISVYGRALDMYLDGKLVRTCLLPGVVHLSPSVPVYLTPDGGFDGWTNRFQYFPGPVNPQEAWDLYSEGYSGLSGWFDLYQLQFSLVQNGTTQHTLTL